MKTPKFWKERGFWAEILLPLSVFYYIFVLTNKLLFSPKKLSVPVICVGNATAGGAGKTPVCLALGNLLKKKKIAFVSRGYGGTLKGPVKVDTKKHIAHDVGDEPLLLAQIAPCWVGKNRLKTASAAIDSGAEIIILDDGLQNLSIEKDISILVVDGGSGFGNHMLIPAGPLRDRLDKTIAKSTFAIIIGEDKTNVANELKSISVLKADILPNTEPDHKEKIFLAFAGIGRPEKFFDTLIENQIRVADTISFPDHYPYKDKDMKELFARAEEKNAELITTEKDYVRLPYDVKDKVTILPIEISWHDEAALKTLLKDYL